jgi:hypothetical protein
MKRILILLSLYCFVVAQYDESGEYYDNTATEMSAQDQTDRDAMLDQFISDAPVVEQQAETAPAEVAQEAPVTESAPENSDYGTIAEPVVRQRYGATAAETPTAASSPVYQGSSSPDITSSTTTYNSDELPEDLEVKIGQTPDIPQFSHRAHVEDVGAECVQCHQTLFAELVRGYKIGPPMKEICSQCHNGEDAREEVIVGFSDEKKYIKPTMPLFSHTTHIQYTERCYTCHRDVYGELKKIKKVPPMSLCSECHNNHQANRNCNVCHENVDEIKPKTHTSRWVYRNGHGVQARFADDKCAECHEERECNQCHRGQSDFAVHRTGYRHSHGMDARQRVSNCGYCHDTELSCAQCHTRNR